MYKSIKKKIYNSWEKIGGARKHSRVRKINIFINVNRRSIIRYQNEGREGDYFTIIKARLWKWFEWKREGIWAKNVGSIKETFNLIEKFKKR